MPHGRLKISAPKADAPTAAPRERANASVAEAPPSRAGPAAICVTICITDITHPTPIPVQ
jgi:hypothetical protein